MLDLEVSHDPSLRFAAHPHVTFEIPLQCFLIQRGGLSAQRGLDVAIEILVGIAFGTIGGKEDQLEEVGMLRNPVSAPRFGGHAACVYVNREASV